MSLKHDPTSHKAEIQSILQRQYCGELDYQSDLQENCPNNLRREKWSLWLHFQDTWRPRAEDLSCQRLDRSRINGEVSHSADWKEGILIIWGISEHIII